MKTNESLSSINVPNTLTAKHSPKPTDVKKTEKPAPQTKDVSQDRESQIRISSSGYQVRLPNDFMEGIAESEQGAEVLNTAQQLGLNRPGELIQAQSNFTPETVLKLLA